MRYPIAVLPFIFFMLFEREARSAIPFKAMMNKVGSAIQVAVKLLAETRQGLSTYAKYTYNSENKLCRSTVPAQTQHKKRRALPNPTGMAPPRQARTNPSTKPLPRTDLTLNPSSRTPPRPPCSLDLVGNNYGFKKVPPQVQAPSTFSAQEGERGSGIGERDGGGMGRRAFWDTVCPGFPHFCVSPCWASSATRFYPTT